MVSDTGGIDDNHSNRQLGKACQEWGKTTVVNKGNGVDNILSSQNLTILQTSTTASLNEYNIIFAIGFKLQKAVGRSCKTNPDAHFAIIDKVVEQTKRGFNQL